MNFLEQKIVEENGIEFAGDVCYSGEYGEQVYTKEKKEGGIPVNGLVYEKYKNGNISYYCYYTNGVENGEKVCFYESGNVESYCMMKDGKISGKLTTLFDNGLIKRIEYIKYGIKLYLCEYDRQGNIIKEQEEIKEENKFLYDKYTTWYEKPVEILNIIDIKKTGINYADCILYEENAIERIYIYRDQKLLPVNGLVYELFSSGELFRYAFYKDGVMNGDSIIFYKTGKIRSYCIMKKGRINGEHVIMDKNGFVTLREICKEGITLRKREYNEKRKIICEIREKSEEETIFCERYDKMYEKFRKL